MYSIIEKVINGNMFFFKIEIVPKRGYNVLGSEVYFLCI